MSEKLSDKEKALLILEKSSENFIKCRNEINKLRKEVYELNKAFENASKMLKICLNEETNNGNIHKDCEYYNAESDCCYNYLIGVYTGLAFEVSRHKECIGDMVKE